MFSVEFASERPSGAAPYYTLVVRDPYIVGSYDSCDIPLQVAGMPDQHVALVVMRESQANRIADGIEESEAEAAHIDFVRGRVTQLMETTVQRGATGSYAVTEDDPLVVFLTVLPPQDEHDEAAAALTAGCVVRVGDVEVPAGSGTIVYDKSEVHIGSDVTLVFHYRPLVVSLQPDDFTLDDIADLLYVYLQLGATVCPVQGGPAPDLSRLPTPIGLLHAADSLRNTTGCLIALAAGYSVVKTSYLPEWFAVVAQSAASPLSVLPPPSRFAVPLHQTTLSGHYTRPESDNCPFPLYPIPSSALRTRQRGALFAGKLFLFYTPQAAMQYETAVSAAGGACYVHPEQTAEAHHALVAAALAAENDDGASAPALFVVLGTDAEATAAADADALAPELNDLHHVLRGDLTAQQASIQVLPGSAVFEALLTNEFSGNDKEVSPSTRPSTISPSMAPTTTSYEPRGAVPHEPIPAHEEDEDMYGQHRAQAPYGGAFSEERPPLSDGQDAEEAEAEAPSEIRVNPLKLNELMTSAQSGAATGRANGETGAAAAGAVPPAQTAAGAYAETPASESMSARGRRRSSLLPRDAQRTPSRSQMRSLVRARASSVNSVSGSGGELGASEHRGSMVSTTTNGTRGRRRLVHIPNEKTESFTDAFDSLRLRIYAFLTKEDPELDRQLVSMQRNHYVADAVMEHTLEVKAQAQDYMEMTDELLVESSGPYTEALRHYWSDCADLDAKAQRLLVGHRRQSTHAVYRRPSFLDSDESVPYSGAAPVPHARSPRSNSLGTPRGTAAAANGGEGRRRSVGLNTPREGGSRTTTPRGVRKDVYHSINHNTVEDEAVDAEAAAPTTEPALLPLTPRSAAMHRAYGQHSGASAPVTVSTRRHSSTPNTPRDATPRMGSPSTHVDPAYATAPSDRPSVPPVDMSSLDGSQRRQAPPRRHADKRQSRDKGASRRDTPDDDDSNHALIRQYRPSTPRQRTVGLEAPMSVRARSSSARRPATDRPAPAENTRRGIERAPAPIASSRHNAVPETAAQGAPARTQSKTRRSRATTPRGRYSPRRSATAAKRPAWQF